MKTAALLLAVLFLTLPIESKADEHQYKFVSQNYAGDSKAGDQAIILDEKTGDMWAYLNQPALGSVAAIKGVMYLGKLRIAQPGQAVIGNFGKQEGHP